MTPVSALFPSVSHHNSKEHIYIPSVVAKYSQWRLRLMPRCRGEGNDESSAILRRLNWLIERSKIGFKNNPSPFEVPKTQQSVELLKKKEKKLMGGANFRPYAHGPPTLAEDSRPAKHLRGVDTRKYDDQLDAYNLACRGQRLDKTTGYPEIVAALCWDLGVTSNTDGSSNNKNVGRASGRPRSAGEQCSAKTFRCQDLLTLSKEQRNIYLRSEALRRPMFTGKSRSYREGAAWYHGSQLTGPLQGAGRMVSEPSTRNCIRMAARTD
uniref:Uncharacterized protein n=1 Tax=Trypanosoma congolense (strain IL3000) TaxID=1068625 RepID=G0UTP9_TRYCI|nr:conserved hypothetical protein [Trypanosoma congolense IL3000]